MVYDPEFLNSIISSIKPLIWVATGLIVVGLIINLDLFMIPIFHIKEQTYKVIMFAILVFLIIVIGLTLSILYSDYKNFIVPEY